MNQNEKQRTAVTEANRKYYDQVAEDYLSNESYAYTEDIVSDVKKLLSVASNKCERRDLFLDLGCGSGFLSKLVKDENLFSKGMGIDISGTQVSLYNENFQGGTFRAVVGDANNLPFEDCSIDMIGGYSVLHHFFDYDSVLKECCRVVRVGGCLYFDFEPNYRFKRSMRFFIEARRKLLDRSPTGDDSLEAMAEFHNNFSYGINIDQLRQTFSGRLEILTVGYRFPGTASGRLLKGLSSLSNCFSPLFYFIARKIG
jgi:ubiquinone/menaquinone biosynthesis C-methylase UbiE